MQRTFQNIIILLPVRTVRVKVTVDRQHTLPLLAVLVTVKAAEQLHIQLTVFRERHDVAVQRLIIIPAEPAPVLKMPKTYHRHIRPRQKLTLLIETLLAPVQRHTGKLLIDNRLALTFRQPEKRIRLTALLVQRHKKLHIEFHIFTSEYLIKLLRNPTDQIHLFLLHPQTHGISSYQYTEFRPRRQPLGM